MTDSAPDSIASGLFYTVIDVSGRQPAELADFVGDVAFTAAWGEQTCRIEGRGGRVGPAVRFHEKDARNGRDLRVWEVSVNTGNEFQARTLSNY